MTPEPDQQDQMKSDNTDMVSQSIEASPLLCNDSAAVDPREFAYRIADEIPKQTNDQRTEDTPNETADHLKEKSAEDSPKETVDQHKVNIACADIVLLTNANRAADESPKQTNDQCTEDTPKQTVDPTEQEQPEQELPQSTTTVSRTSDTSYSGAASTSSHTGLVPSNGFRYFLELPFFVPLRSQFRYNDTYETLMTRIIVCQVPFH